MHPTGRVGSDHPLSDDRVHPEATQEEWTFSWWAPDGSIAGVTGYRLIAPRSAWYWWALARPGHPLLHLTEYEIPRRSDPMIAKPPEMWAQFTCEHPFEQWTVGNEGHAVELDDPDDALGLAYGRPAPMSSDLEWYATGPARDIVAGYEQPGVLHGDVELVAGVLELSELQAHRTHRWTRHPGAVLPPRDPGPAVAHLGLRAPFQVSRRQRV